jgi:serine/threonine-protein kinase
MAKVFRGEDTVLGRAVAIKVLAPQFADDPNFVTRFRREAQAAARISNQNLVSVFDTGSDDGVHYIVMEYVEGKTLAEFLTGGGRIMPDRAIDITMDVCRALEAAHAQGVIHRDIKPGNIMIDPRGQVKVTDFGIARMVTTSETIAETAAVLGTASYLSPEQAQGQAVDGRSDLYSLGCVLYEMVTGRPPFLGESPVAVASKHVLEQPTAPSKLNRDVTPDLDAVILRAMAKNPANRYQSAEEFRADLERVKRGLPVEATPLLPAAAATQALPREPAPTAVLPPSEPERSRWWIPVLVTLLILGILGVVLWLLAQNLLNNDDQNGQPTLVDVPNVVGKKLNAARTDIEDAGLVVAEPVIEEPAADHPDEEPGTVLAQDPTPDEGQVEEGSQVILTVVAQAEAVPIPDLSDQSLADAQQALIDLGLVPFTQDQASVDVTPGNVIATDPPAGQEVEPGSTVTILVSTGPSTVTVPQVTCISINAAQNQLRQAGLVPALSTQSVPINPACPNGNKVAQQDPAAGTQVDEGSTVTLFTGVESEPTGSTGPSGGTGPTA